MLSSFIELVCCCIFPFLPPFLWHARAELIFLLFSYRFERRGIQMKRLASFLSLFRCFLVKFVEVVSLGCCLIPTMRQLLIHIFSAFTESASVIRAVHRVCIFHGVKLETAVRAANRTCREKEGKTNGLITLLIALDVPVKESQRNGITNETALELSFRRNSLFSHIFPGTCAHRSTGL